MDEEGEATRQDKQRADSVRMTALGEDQEPGAVGVVEEEGEGAISKTATPMRMRFLETLDNLLQESLLGAQGRLSRLRKKRQMMLMMLTTGKSVLSVLLLSSIRPFLRAIIEPATSVP